MDTSGSTASSCSLPSYTRSCSSCRLRKVKCDRQQPCVNCTRAGTECVYPPGRGRAPKRSRNALNAQLSERLSKLENIIRSLETESAAVSPHNHDAKARDIDSNPSVEQRLGRLLIDDTRSYYVSNVMWANLGDEIAELRDLLHEPDMEEDQDGIADGSVPARPMPSGSNAAILGFRALAHSLCPYHPPLAQSVNLLEIFKENVAPMVRIFHMPTLIRSHWDAIASLGSLDRNIEALLFAIYYAAVISMDPEQCESTLGVSKAHASEMYLFAVEQALARADLLNTQSLTLMQAAVLFLFALRNEDDSRTVWSLTSLVFHIAQAMGLHRDGIVFGLRPMETELRRRLWWHICLLDARSSEYHGCEPIVRQSSFDTKLPLNIEDSDLSADMIEPPGERNGATGMYFCLIRCEVMRALWNISFVAPNMEAPGYSRGSDRLPLKEREAIVQNLQDRLENQYLKHCDTSKPFFLASTFVARLMVARAWLIARYPLGDKEYGAGLSVPMRDHLFLSSIEVLKLSSLVLTNEQISHWSWHSKTHIQWHAVAFVLSEICSRPRSADCDWAWEYVNTVYDNWKMKESGRKGTLWRPIKRLMAKAQYVRHMQKVNSEGQWDQGNQTGVSSAVISLDMQNGPGAITYPGAVPPDQAYTAASEGLPSDLLMEPLDLFGEFFPGDPLLGGSVEESNDIFEAILHLDDASRIPGWLTPE
ncbi:Zn(II)2Cys6 transcription factor [Aspergillus heteromorphus CBS 117.55]|uniref:Zn(II)2Cys6 transcription factor n=1 Tax=Aspergillus heteromorphus CBS 117.55 TaxID=1448321 RepID=A0A317WHG6_9EURO|nr:Zn(II)2Cys6 transcription factor [Aspergillus heteromorphus CBS 117.55]PWY85091.1 Zn(II)2Cys6 transcription factor [Aspergillus heteromorphus CBS 117.55]